MYSHLQSFLFRLDPERAHRLAMTAGRIAQDTVPFLLESRFTYAHPSLHTRLFSKHFTNPVGLAAGFDKNAVLIPFWKKLGFGFVEIGSVSARKCRGNERPRAFRLPEDRAIINRMGLNNQGAARISKRIRLHAGTRAFPIGINLAKTHDPSIEGDAAIADFCLSFRTMAPLADYIVLNISCPNTSEGKTFEDPNALDDLLRAIARERGELDRDLPLMVKLSPPLTDNFVLDSLIDEQVMVALAHGVNGFIATNTSPDRQHVVSPASMVDKIGPGGLSGPPIETRSTQLVRYLYRKTGGDVPVIGVGGINSAETAYSKIRAGASLVQLFTGLVYEGPGLVKSIKEGLVHLLHEDGFSTIGEAVGQDA